MEVHACWISTVACLVLCIMCMESYAVDSSIRLHAGFSENEGFVLVNMTGVWQAICKDDWDPFSVLVACRQLGFTEGYALKWEDTDYQYPNSWRPRNESKESFPIRRTKFVCNGSEASLSSCQVSDRSNDYCSTYGGVACNISTAELTTLLDNVRNDYVSLSYDISNGVAEGLVLVTEIFKYSEHDHKMLVGGICNLDDRAAMLICERRGYPNGGKPAAFPSPERTIPMVLSELDCVYTDTLSSCRKVFSLNGDCSQAGVMNNGVQCYTSLRPSVIGALSFVAQASIIIVVAGICGICWVQRHGKNPPADRRQIHLTVSGNEFDSLGQATYQPSS
nr:neurotrypsin-like [Lytechinus pictus]